MSGQRGASAAEYLGVIAAVAVLMGGLVAVGEHRVRRQAPVDPVEVLARLVSAARAAAAAAGPAGAGDGGAAGARAAPAEDGAARAAGGGGAAVGDRRLVRPAVSPACARLARTPAVRMKRTVGPSSPASSTAQAGRRSAGVPSPTLPGFTNSVPSRRRARGRWVCPLTITSAPTSAASSRRRSSGESSSTATRGSPGVPCMTATERGPSSRRSVRGRPAR